MKATKWKKRDSKLNNDNISFKMRQKKTYLKAQKMFEISQTWFPAWARIQINYSRKSESVSFSHKFCSYLIGCGFAYRAKSWIQLRINVYINITILVFLSPGSCFKSAICHSKLSWKCTDRLVFVAVEGRKNYSQEKFEGSVHLDLPFWGHLNID